MFRLLWNGDEKDFYRVDSSVFLPDQCLLLALHECLLRSGNAPGVVRSGLRPDQQRRVLHAGAGDPDAALVDLRRGYARRAAGRHGPGNDPGTRVDLAELVHWGNWQASQRRGG